MNDRFSVIVVFDTSGAQTCNDRIITRKIDYNDYIENKEIFNVDESMSKVFPNGFNISIGESVDVYNDDGTKKKNSELMDLGLLKLGDDETLDGEEIRKLTEVEQYKIDLLKKDINIESKTIDTDEQGNEYIREKTILEKYNDELITKDEYNKYQEEQRANKYQNTTDLMYQTLSVRKLRGDISDDDYVLETEKIEAMILKVKAEFPYVE